MKPIPNSNSEPGPLLVFGAHPDDIEFGCGAIVALETRAGRRVHLVVCSKGEAGTYGGAEQRVAEAQAAAKVFGASLEFVELDGDAHLELARLTPSRWPDACGSTSPTSCWRQQSSRISTPTTGGWVRSFAMRCGSRLRRPRRAARARATSNRTIVLLRSRCRRRTSRCDANLGRCLASGRHCNMDRRDAGPHLSGSSATTSSCN